MRDAKRVNHYDFLMGQEVTFKGKIYVIDGTWCILEKESLYIALKKNGCWLNVPAHEVIKLLYERTQFIS